jgi:ArsR family transcriptional regulator
MDTAVIDHLSVLSDAIRVRMLYILEGRELTVSEICDVMQLPQSTVSRHLKTLSEGAWVASRRDGTHRLYTLPLDDVEPSARRLWEVVREQVQTSEDERRLKHVLARRRFLSEAFFSSAAGQWDKLREELFGATSHLRALAGMVDPEAVIGDLGCGTGRVTELLAPFARRIVAVDASTEMLKAARANVGNKKNVDLRQGPLEKLPI